MDPLEGQTISHPLAEGGAPIEWPDEQPVRRPGAARWIGLAAFAIIGATAILIASGIGDETRSAGASLIDPVKLGPQPGADAGVPAPQSRGDGYRARE